MIKQLQPTSAIVQCASFQETWEIEMRLVFNVSVMWRKFMLTIAFMV